MSDRYGTSVAIWRCAEATLLLALVFQIHAALLGVPSAHAQASSPGELSSRHRDLACGKCHAADQSAPAAKCVACHSRIADQQAAARGLHGGPLAQQRRCSSCHREHRGAQADLRGWKELGGVAALQHASVGFAFTAGHARFADSPCEVCHTRKGGKSRFASETSLCSTSSCHPDVHAGTAGPDCQSCHSTDSWRVRSSVPPAPQSARSPKLRFDHARDTRFPLVGRHQDAAERGRCASCHRAAAPSASGIPSLPFAKGNTDCYSCHRRDDEENGHRGARGRDCAGCHTPKVRYFWDARGLPAGHSQANPPLGGAHDRLPCLTCHTGWRKLAGQADACVSCHARDDIHHNALGPRCGDCHNQQSFLGARFRHDSVGCTLRGVHRVLPCADCHKGGNYAGLTPVCIGCHRDDAMRAAAQNILPELHVQQTACTGCHNTNTFRLGIATRQSPPESVCQ